MKIDNATFVLSSPDLKRCPESPISEYAFIGRSNVGKSSLINMLVNKKGLAKTSSKPGKTQLINFFLINNSWHLVDLPGYGFAKVAKESRVQWEKQSRNYLAKRANLKMIFLLIDSRIPPQKIDIEFMLWLSEEKLAFTLLFTKCDKLATSKISKNIKLYGEKLRELFDSLPIAIQSSTKTGDGKEQILDLIDHMNHN